VTVSNDLTLVGVQPEPNTLTAKLIKVDYEKESQAAKSKATLKRVLRILEDEDTARALLVVDKHQVLGYSAFFKGVEDLLMDDIAGFKHGAFHEEQEWRLIVRPRIFLKQGTDDGRASPAPLYFRSSNGTLVPYIKLIPLRGKLPISSVRLGPSLSKRAEAAVQMMLNANGYSTVTVHSSDIPVLL
jgi:hypothetical protein